ncbi:hypothetical protein Pan44_06010 [Caulifigura coniformis]|uniref:Uncharacterized protein n=1 Tax=Caulifigura coniformis TaxID=2527983 RepID=A0A517S905_9PLAN|nr:hypothetical protein [Caulifigura coniformis]QDT52589.1 hypothetical protein Pan44_06010 [Caulifigura coniformis]
MTVDSSLVDRIVHGVLQQLRTPGPFAAKPVPPAAAPLSAPAPRPAADCRIGQPVITARLIEELVPKTATGVVVAQRAVVTPAALDVVRARKLTIRREAAAAPETSPPARTLTVIVRNTPAVERLGRQNRWRRELLGCPDDAAALAISTLSRGDADRVVIFAAQSHRAACLANRNSAVKAAAIASFDDLRSVLEQLRVNVLCVDPTGRTDFELTRIIDLFEKPRPVRSKAE